MSLDIVINMVISAVTSMLVYILSDRFDSFILKNKHKNEVSEAAPEIVRDKVELLNIDLSHSNSYYVTKVKEAEQLENMLTFTALKDVSDLKSSNTYLRLSFYNHDFNNLAFLDKIKIRNGTIYSVDKEYTLISANETLHLYFAENTAFAEVVMVFKLYNLTYDLSDSEYPIIKPTNIKKRKKKNRIIDKVKKGI